MPRHQGRGGDSPRLLRDALRGRPHAARSYVAAYGELADKLLAAHAEGPSRPGGAGRRRAVLRAISRAMLARRGGAAQRLRRRRAVLGLGSAAESRHRCRPRAAGPGASASCRAPRLFPCRPALPTPASRPIPACSESGWTTCDWSCASGESDLARIQAVFGLSVTELGAAVRRETAGGERLARSPGCPPRGGPRWPPWRRSRTSSRTGSSRSASRASSGVPAPAYGGRIDARGHRGGRARVAPRFRT